MKKVSNRLRVSHFPQIPCEPFIVEVKDEEEAYKIYNVLANQHLFLFKNRIIPDYSNIIIVEMFENNEWCEYWNEKEMMEWDELVEKYFT